MGHLFCFMAEEVGTIIVEGKEGIVQMLQLGKWL